MTRGGEAQRSALCIASASSRGTARPRTGPTCATANSPIAHGTGIRVLTPAGERISAGALARFGLSRTLPDEQAVELQRP